MNYPLLILTSVIYILISASYLWQEGRPGMALCFVSYALANVGLIMDLTK